MDARKALSLLIGVAALSACGYRPFDYHLQQEIPRGPGTLTGEDGAAVLRAKQSPQASDAWSIVDDSTKPISIFGA